MGPQIPQRLTDQTAERLLHMIGSDPAYRPGAKLPNEPRLCELFGGRQCVLWPPRAMWRSGEEAAPLFWTVPARRTLACSGWKVSVPACGICSKSG